MDALTLSKIELTCSDHEDMLDSVTQNDAASGLAPWTIIGRPARSARDRILVTAVELFCREGYTATGVDTISEQAGASKSTLYKHFSSKEDLIAAALEAEGAAWRSWFYGALGHVHGGPQDRLAGLFDVLQDWFQSPHFYGCAFLNAISEAACDDDRPRILANAHKSHLLKWLHSQALELGANPAPLSQAMVVLIDGAIMAAHASRDASVAQSAKALAIAYLNANARPDGRAS